MFRKILISISIIVSVCFIYFQHAVVFNPSEVKVITKNFDLSGVFEGGYKKYFYLKDENPRYVWNSDVFQKYAEYCHSGGKNCMIFPHQQFYADTMWIGSIQYIGSVIDSMGAKYLYSLLDNLTTITPYWNYPYIFGELLLPANKSYLDSSGSSELVKKTWFNSVEIGEKAKYYNCNPFKSFLINGLSSEQFYKEVYSKPLPFYYANPCSNGDIPNYLGFNYFYYLSNFEKSSENYKLSSFNEDTPPIAASMYSIVIGKGGNHEKSMQIWFSKFLSMREKIGTSKNPDEIKIYEDQLEEAVKKGVNELQYYLIQMADKKVETETGCYHNYKCITDKGLIKQSVDDIVTDCMNYKMDQTIFSGSLLIDDTKKSEFYNNVKCILLSYGVQNGYIDIKNKTINYPFNNTGSAKLDFSWNQDYNDWGVSIVK